VRWATHQSWCACVHSHRSVHGSSTMQQAEGTTRFFLPPRNHHAEQTMQHGSEGRRSRRRWIGIGTNQIRKNTPKVRRKS
jgi:hypothetical protein